MILFITPCNYIPIRHEWQFINVGYPWSTPGANWVGGLTIEIEPACLTVLIVATDDANADDADAERLVYKALKAAIGAMPTPKHSRPWMFVVSDAGIVDATWPEWMSERRSIAVTQQLEYRFRTSQARVAAFITKRTTADDRRGWRWPRSLLPWSELLSRYSPCGTPAEANNSPAFFDPSTIDKALAFLYSGVAPEGMKEPCTAAISITEYYREQMAELLHK